MRGAGRARHIFWPDAKAALRFFGSSPDQTTVAYANEASPEWLYFLTDHQKGVLASLKKGIRRATSSQTRFYFVVGGPGTGKTSLLLKLLLDLGAEGRDAWIRLTPEVRRMVERAGSVDLSRSSVQGHTSIEVARERGTHIAEVLLVDDPSGPDEIEQVFEEARGIRRAVVVAFDPCQLVGDKDLDDELYELFIDEFRVKAFELRECYRQKEALGRASKRVMDRVAESSPFLAQAKQQAFAESHSLVYRLANNLRFPNPRGYEETYAEATADDVAREIGRIRKGGLWTHWPPLLIVVDPASGELPAEWRRHLKRVDAIEVSLRQLLSVKGLEFQHAFVFLGRELYNDLENGFSGSGRSVYHARRLLRIPFSRPKDSLVTFVLGLDPRP